MFKIGQRANCFSKFGKELGQLEGGELQEPSCRWYQLHHQGTVINNYLIDFISRRLNRMKYLDMFLILNANRLCFVKIGQSW